MLMFDASSSCWFNSFISKFIDIIYYRKMIYQQSLAVFTYNTTYTQTSMLIFMFMCIQRVRIFSSISYREGRMCALTLTLIAFIYGIIVSYTQLYGAFCVEELNLNKNQTFEIDLLIKDAKHLMNKECRTARTTAVLTDVIDNLVINSTTSFSSSVPLYSSVYSSSTSIISTNSSHSTSILSSVNYNNSLSLNSNSACYSEADWYRFRHHTIAYVYLQPYMSLDWADEYVQRSKCRLESILPQYLLASIHNLTWPLLQSHLSKDYFHEHQFCTQTHHYIFSYANCSFPLAPDTFQRWYKFLYDRRLSIKNRYTIGFIAGTFIPSCICIISSFICLFYISNRPSIRKHSYSRAELRSLSLILVEVLLSLVSALQSYIINFFTCHRLLFRMESDNCYGQSSNDILPNFLGSILELFTSTSNILILMICGAQFRNELRNILHLQRFLPRRLRCQQSSTLSQHRRNYKRSKISSPLHVTLSLPSWQNGTGNKRDMSQEPSVDSFLASVQNKDNICITEIEQQSDQIRQYAVKSTAV